MRLVLREVKEDELVEVVQQDVAGLVLRWAGPPVLLSLRACLLEVFPEALALDDHFAGNEAIHESVTAVTHRQSELTAVLVWLDAEARQELCGE